MRLILLVLFTMSFLFGSDIINTDKEFTSLCIEDARTGFSWENKGWKQADFIEEKYIVKKKSNTTFCKVKNKDNKFEKDGINFASGCYSYIKHGSNSGVDLDIFNECREVWKYVDDKYVLIRVHCDNIAFNPNGNFMKHHVSGHLEDNPRGDYKDPITISHGKCTVL